MSPLDVILWALAAVVVLVAVGFAALLVMFLADVGGKS